MSIKPIQSERDLEAYLSENYDPLNLSIKKVNDNFKATLIYEDTKEIKTYRIIRNIFQEIL